MADAGAFEGVVLELEAEGLLARRVAEADATAASILEAARAEAEAQIVNATQRGKDMVAEARSVRERMLADLVHSTGRLDKLWVSERAAG